jgi:hypothetical protein
MDVVYPRCSGLDVHKKTVVECVIVPGAKGKPQKMIRTFGTMTDDLLALGDWLAEREVTHVAMESTGVYWQPIWNLLEERFTLLLINAHHIKQVPGRKTDVGDCEWIADLLRHGLLKGSFVPDRSQRELRELTRYRTVLMQERAAEVNRLQKTLEGRISNWPRVKDATDLAALLIDPSHCGYPPGNVRILQDEEATQTATREALATVAKQSTPDSTVMLYFSGTGVELSPVPWRGEYLLPVDADYTSDESLAQTCISGDEFAEVSCAPDNGQRHSSWPRWFAFLSEHIVRAAAIAFDESGHSLLLVRDATGAETHLKVIMLHLASDRTLVTAGLH